LFVCDQEHSFCAGNTDYVQVQEKKIYAIAARYGGIPAGETNGEVGYTLTFVIAYIRVSAVLLFLISVWLSELLITVPPTNVMCNSLNVRNSFWLPHHSQQTMDMSHLSFSLFKNLLCIGDGSNINYRVLKFLSVMLQPAICCSLAVASFVCYVFLQYERRH